MVITMDIVGATNSSVDFEERSSKEAQGCKES